MTGDAGTTDATEHKQQAKVLTVSDGVMAGVRKDSSKQAWCRTWRPPASR